MKKNKFVVYTALFGDYDDLIDPKENYDGCDFICFTDQMHLKSDIWKIRIVEVINLPLNMMNRKYKILPHLFLSEYEQSLYVDANIYIIRNPLDLAKKYLCKYDFAVPKHFARNCIYDEAKELIKTKRLTKDNAIQQINFYKKEGFPENYSLVENNILFRNHNKNEIKFLMAKWWEQIHLFTQRDQLSLMYLVWKYSIQLCSINENGRNGEYFRLKLHKKERKNGLIGFALNTKSEFFINNPNSIILKTLKYIKGLISGW